MFSKNVFTPGPTQVPKLVLNALSGSVAYHRSAEFKEFHTGLISKLKSIFFTGYNLNLLTASGTGAMETAVVNFCNRADKVLFVNQGRFGMRWGSICKEYGINTDELFLEPGDSVSTQDFDKFDLNVYSAILLTHVETSTGTITNLKAITDYIKAHCNALVIVDSVTSVGAVEFRMDEWDVDVAISASQKGLMTPPGISMIAYNDKAKEKMFSNDNSRFYLDLRRESESQVEGFTSWTPSVNVIYGLNKACDIVNEYGLEKWWKKTADCAQFVRNKGKEIGLGLFSKNPCDSLTAFTMPDGIPSGNLVRVMKSKYGVQMANGQAEMKDKIFRASHMGDLFMEDFENLMFAIEEELNILRNAG